MVHRSARLGVALSFLAVACHRPEPVPPALPWAVIVRAVDAPAGASEAGAQRCRPDGEACTTVEAGAQLTGDYALRTIAGARVWLDLGGGTTLEIAGHASATFAGGDHPTVQLSRGAFAIEAPVGVAPDFRVDAGGRAVAIDPALPAALEIRATDGARADVTVRRGRVTVGDGAAAVELRSGDSARLRSDRPIERGVAVGLDPEIAPRHEDRPAAEQGQPRGLGTMTARVPGTSEIVSGVRLVSHRVNVVVRDGFARTEVEEEFANDTARVLEGRYVFPVPPEASLSRLALWVGSELVEGEMVERERAATIFKSIVDDSVRPRDPALLEWASASELSLKVFPLPPHGSRKVVLAYDQALAAQGGRARYVYPLSLGADRATRIDDFEIRVAASDAKGPLGEAETPGYAADVREDCGGLGGGFHAKAFTPAADFVLAFDTPPTSSPAAGATVPAALTETKGGADRFVAVRIPVAWPEGAAPPPRVRRDRAVVVDVSHSQSKETLAGEIAVAEGAIAALDPDERFVLLACDSACAAFPEDGLAPAAVASIEEARAWLRKRSIGGSSDVAGALLTAARRLDPGGAGQIVLLGDGAPTSGELAAETIAARVRPELSARQIDLRLLGAGRTVDAVVLEGLARALGASYERLGDGEPLARRVDDLAIALRAPLLRNAALTASGGLRDVYPRVLPSLRVGSELIVLARMDAGATGEVRLSGDLGGVAFATARPADAREASPVVPRLWAAARIAELEASADPAAGADVVALSKRHHVLSRRTSLIVLENDRMFAEFGIPRTQRAPGLDDIGTIGHGASASAASTPTITERVTFGSRDPNAPIAPWDQDRAPDADTPAAQGKLWGGDLGESFGKGGLGLSGVGEGGGGTGQGFGSGHGRLGGSHRTQPPSVRMGATSVSGRMPPEVIQRIVRQNFGRFRLCYENGLRTNPDLAGRVSVRFVIGTNGSVTNVANGGSDLPDSAVVGCVVRAFNGLAFPEPEGGIITVTYPILFSPSSGSSAPSAQRPFADNQGTTLQSGDDRWMREGDDAIEKLRKAVDEQATSRQRHEALIRGLIVHGRFADALAASRRFAEIDPDEARAEELLAGAAAAAGDADTARTALDAAVELSPRSTDLHARAARAFEAAGDEPRACAHWRALAALQPGADDMRYQAWRCRARLGEREAALAEARAMDKPGKQVTALMTTLASAAAPAYDATTATPGTFEATVRCDSDEKRCPTLVVVRPNGDVISPWSPSSRRSSTRIVALTAGLQGTYRTLLVGGAPDARGEIIVRALETARTFRFDHGGLQTVAMTTVQGWGGFH